MGWRKECVRCDARFGASGLGRPLKFCSRCHGPLRQADGPAVGRAPNPSQLAPNADDELPVVCWCQASVVLVARRDMLAGRTLSCGGIDCVPTEAAC